MKVGGVPFEQGNTHGPLHPIAIVLHRTYGGWAGSKGVAFDSAGLGFHFLIAKDHGKVVQLADTAQKCWHAKGGNSWSVGVEFEGRNEDTLTTWQVVQAAKIVSAVAKAHAIPLDYMPPNAGRPPPSGGVRNHANVPGSDHTDFVAPADWQRIVAAMGGAQFPEDDDMFSDQDRQTVEDLRAQVAALTQLVQPPQVTVEASSGGALWCNGTEHRAFVSESGHLERWVFRDGQWECDLDEAGFVPGTAATIRNCTDSRGRWLWHEVSAAWADGLRQGRVIWTPGEGRRPGVEVVG